MSRFFERYWQFFGCRVALFLLGFLWIPHKVFSPLRPTAASSNGIGVFGHKVKPRQVFICNHISFTDVLYLSHCFSPRFVYAPTGEKVAPNVGVEMGFLRAIIQTLSPKPVPHEQAVSVESIIKNAKTPIVIFAEGGTSNGQGILQFWHVVGLHGAEIHAGGFRSSCAFPVGSWVSNIIQITSRLYQKMEFVHIPPPSLPLCPPLKEDVSLEGESRDEYFKLLRRALGDALGIPPLTINIKEKKKFREYWDERQSYKHKIHKTV